MGVKYSCIEFANLPKKNKKKEPENANSHQMAPFPPKKKPKKVESISQLMRLGEIKGNIHLYRGIMPKKKKHAEIVSYISRT